MSMAHRILAEASVYRAQLAIDQAPLPWSGVVDPDQNRVVAIDDNGNEVFFVLILGSVESAMRVLSTIVDAVNLRGGFFPLPKGEGT